MQYIEINLRNAQYHKQEKIYPEVKENIGSENHA